MNTVVAEAHFTPSSQKVIRSLSFDVEKGAVLAIAYTQATTGIEPAIS